MRGNVQGHSGSKSSEAGTEARSLTPVRALSENVTLMKADWRKRKTRTRGLERDLSFVSDTVFHLTSVLGDRLKTKQKRRNLAPDSVSPPM